MDWFRQRTWSFEPDNHSATAHELNRAYFQNIMYQVPLYQTPLKQPVIECVAPSQNSMTRFAQTFTRQLELL
jgi:hypothetical protein